MSYCINNNYFYRISPHFNLNIAFSQEHDLARDFGFTESMREGLQNAEIIISNILKGVKEFPKKAEIEYFNEIMGKLCKYIADFFNGQGIDTENFRAAVNVERKKRSDLNES